MGNVAKLSGKTIGGQAWIRVHGPNICPQYDENAKRNKSRLVDAAFKKACEVVGIPATNRQASKWNNKKGAAYNFDHKIEMNGFVVADV